MIIKTVRQWEQGWFSIIYYRQFTTLHVFAFTSQSDGRRLQAQELLISRLMEGKATNWELAKRCAEQIRSPEYTTRHFHAAWSKGIERGMVMAVTGCANGVREKWQRQNVINETSVY